MSRPFTPFVRFPLQYAGARHKAGIRVEAKAHDLIAVL